MKHIQINNEGEMEACIEFMMELLKSKKEPKIMSVYVPNKNFAEIFLTNANREINFHRWRKNPEIEIRVYVKGDEDDEEKAGA